MKKLFIKLSIPLSYFSMIEMCRVFIFLQTKHLVSYENLCSIQIIWFSTKKEKTFIFFHKELHLSHLKYPLKNLKKTHWNSAESVMVFGLQN